jgi:hypothetical protein
MRYPVTLAAPDGRRITCYDGEHAAAVHLLTDWLIWGKVGQFVRDRDGDIDWTRLEAQSAAARLQRAAAGRGRHGPVRRPPRRLRGGHPQAAVPSPGRPAPRPGAGGGLLLRPDAAPPGIGQALGGQVRWQFGGGDSR